MIDSILHVEGASVVETFEKIPVDESLWTELAELPKSAKRIDFHQTTENSYPKLRAPVRSDIVQLRKNSFLSDFYSRPRQKSSHLVHFSAAFFQSNFVPEQTSKILQSKSLYRRLYFLENFQLSNVEF